MPSIVAISGTSRRDNYTSRALTLVTAELARRGHEITTLDARQMTLGFPDEPETEDAQAMQSAVRAAAALVIATPEYHGTFSAMLKLILENMGFPSAIKNKPVALLGVAAGRIGAIKSLEHLRSVCSHMGAIVMPNAVSIASIQQVFDKNGKLRDPSVGTLLNSLGESLEGFMRVHFCPTHEMEAIVRGEKEEHGSTV